MNVRKSLNKINKKLNQFYKKMNLPFTIIAGFGCLVGLICHYLEGMSILAKGGLIISTIFAGLPILHKALQAIRVKVIGIELLVSIAVIGALMIGELHEAGIVTFLFQFGNLLELKTIEATRKEIKSLTKLMPTKALRLEGESIMEIDADDVEEDDLLLVRTGDRIAADGLVIAGEGYVNEASITGESLPVRKVENDKLYAGTILDSGTIHMRATKVGEDTSFAKIINLVEEAQDAKSPIDRFIDRFAKWYTPLVIILAFATLILRKIFLRIWDVDTAITVLVLACPGALVIGSPIANVAGVGQAAKQGIILKGGDSLHTFAKTQNIVLDKTGTITDGKPKVIASYYYGNDEMEDKAILGAMEKQSSHPLAKAILEFAGDSLMDVSVETIKGVGLKANYDTSTYYVGNERNINMDNEQAKLLAELKSHGSSIVIMCKNDELIYIFELADTIKKEAVEFIDDLKKFNMKHIIMASGDNKQVVKYVADMIGITQYYGELLPEEKMNLLKSIKDEGKLTFIGDGINDSPALAFADTGIAMGNGTEVAIETSDVIIMKSKLTDIGKALRIAKKTVLISYENIIIAVGTVCLLLIGLLAGYIHMSLGMLIHEGSILLVIINAMRLLKGE